LQKKAVHQLGSFLVNTLTNVYRYFLARGRRTRTIMHNVWSDRQMLLHPITYAKCCIRIESLAQD